MDNTANQPDQATSYISLREAWEEIRHVQSTVQQCVSNGTEDFRDAVAMTATELAENVIKHSSEPSSGTMTVSHQDGDLVITTKSRVRSFDQANAVREQIQRLSDADARELYIARMLELMSEPESTNSGLGLLRIAYEGAFKLSCELLGDRLHIHARRPIDEIPS